MKTGERPQLMLISIAGTHTHSAKKQEFKYTCKNGRGIALMVVNPIFYER